MDPSEIYEITRRWWKIDPKRASNYKYVFAIYRGIIRQIFKVTKWEETDIDNRYEFEGEIVRDEEMNNRYLYKSVKQYFSHGNQNPIRYIN